MSRFRFRLQRVLDYRSSLVEAQEAELGRRAFQLRRAEQGLAAVVQSQSDLIAGMDATAAGPVRPDRAVTAWDYWKHLRREQERSAQTVRERAAEVDEARVRLTDLRKEEKAMEKLKERQSARAEVAERQQEVKNLDDLTTTRLGRGIAGGWSKVSDVAANPVLMRLQAALLREVAANLKCEKRGPTLSAAGPSDFDSLIEKAAAKYGVDPALVKGLIDAESDFDATAVSAAGAKGLMQLMDGTAASLGVSDSFDPAQNIDGGVRFLSSLLDRYGGDVEMALAAYNAGPGAVDKAGGVPDIAETQVYVPRVLSYRDEYAGSSGWEA